MFGSKEYTGIILDDDLLKVAHLRVDKGQLRLLKLDRFSLISDLEKKVKRTAEDDDFGESELEIEEEADSIFGLEEAMEDEGEEEINFDDLEEEPEEEDLLSLDMVDEAETAQSNELLLYNILNDISPKEVRVGLNISAGHTIFQIIRDTNFKEVKKKDLVSDLEDKLESIYGMPKSSDKYAYEIRENGSLVLASIDEESPLLGLADRTQELYNGKFIIEDILSDEAILVGLVRANYHLPNNQITGIIQFGQKKCRIVFMKGEEIWLVSPIINEGTKNKGFLNTVFSKILFQLDTGEVPNLDRLILTNNSLGAEAVEFFRKNFPDISVEEFRFDQAKFSMEDQDPASASAFTTAIGMAWAASGFEKESFPALSLIPSYILDRQKIFKLQWHGFILLLLIGLAPVVLNYFYQQNVQEIQSLKSELSRINTQIKEITPIVNSTNELSNELSLLRDKLVLLDTLSRGSREWSAKLNILNDGVSTTRSSWFTSLEMTQDGYYVDGYTLYRNQIPRIVDIFKEATLLNVSIEEEREQEVYRFSILIKEFSGNKSIYSPTRPEDLRTILGN